MDSLVASIVAGLAVIISAVLPSRRLMISSLTCFGLRPELESHLKDATTSDQLQQVLEEASGVIEAADANGSINVDEVYLTLFAAYSSTISVEPSPSEMRSSRLLLL